MIFWFSKVFYDFSSVFWELIRNSWFIARKYCFYPTFSVLFDSLKICFHFVRVFCEFYRFLWICWGLMDLSGLFGMFLIRFGFFCIFFGFLAIVEIDFRSLIKIFWNFGFSYVFQRFFLGFLGFYKKFVIYS